MAERKKKGAKIVEAFDAADAAQPKPPDEPPSPPGDDEMLASCPVQPLGHRKGIYFYISVQGRGPRTAGQPTPLQQYRGAVRR